MKKLTTIALLFLFACKDPYTPKVANSQQQYLAVDGFINATPGAVTRIRLTNTTNVNDTASVTPIHQATVQVVQGSATYQLTETGDSGYYQSQAMQLTMGNCQLLIKTADDKHFASDSIPVLDAGILDTLVYARGANSLQLYLDAHRESTASNYYRWDFVETWEYHPPYQSTVAYDWSRRMLSFRTPEQNDSLYRCFQTAVSHSIEVNTTASLAQNIVHQYPITFIRDTSVKISVLYSILVNQYATNAAAYNYFALLKKTTQELGDVFGPIPTELKSNIQPTDGARTTVIGYMTASTVTTRRFFISHDQVPGWKFDFGNRIPIVNLMKGVSLPGYPLDDQSRYYFEQFAPCPPLPGTDKTPPCSQPYQACCTKAYPLYYNDKGLLFAYDSTCADCMFWGQGGRKKPAYWPN